MGRYAPRTLPQYLRSLKERGDASSCSSTRRLAAPSSRKDIVSAPGLVMTISLANTMRPCDGYAAGIHVYSVVSIFVLVTLSPVTLVRSLDVHGHQSSWEHQRAWSLLASSHDAEKPLLLPPLGLLASAFWLRQCPCPFPGCIFHASPPAPTAPPSYPNMPCLPSRRERIQTSAAVARQQSGGLARRPACRLH